MRPLLLLLIAFIAPLAFASGPPPYLAAGGLEALAIEGHELHPSLKTRLLDQVPAHEVPQGVGSKNPHHSTDTEFLEAVARGGSQGRLGPLGIRSALYARHNGESDLGLYGLEAQSLEDANRWENALRGIWAHNTRLGRAQVHRSGWVLVVVWNDGMSARPWQEINANVAERLGVR